MRGISVHTHQSIPSTTCKTVTASSVSGLLRKCLIKNLMATIEKTARTKPGMRYSTTRRKVAQNGTLGCGVDKSRLPQREQASAFRGFTCNFRQSLML